MWILAIDAGALVAGGIADAATGGLEDRLLTLLGQAGIVGGILYWLTRSLIPRLQDDAKSARDQFLIEAKATRDEFLATLGKEREANDRRHEKSIEANGVLTDAVRSLKDLIKARLPFNAGPDESERIERPKP